ALVEITTPLGAVDGVGVEAQTKKAPSSSPDNGTANSKETPGEATEDAPASGDGPEDDGEAEEEEGEAEGEADEHQDRILKNCRPARPSDGLLILDELCQLYDLSRPPPSSEGGYDPNTHPDARSTLTTRTASSGNSPIGLQSTYGSFYNHLKAQGEEQAQEEADGLEAGNFFGSASRGRERWNDDTWTPDSPNSHLGDGHEPMWTLFSPLFSLTLDYIFLFPRISGASSSEQEGGAGDSGTAASYLKVTALLRTHRTEVLQPGTPRKFVNASDHVAIGAEIAL
ncbi:RNA exonuclease ngl2, partial [Tilletia horrida]